DIKLRPVRNEVVAHLFDVRVMGYLDSAFLQLPCVRRNVCQVIGNKSDAMAKLVKELKDLEHAQRARVAVQHREMMIDHKNVFATQWQLPQGRQIAINGLCYQLVSPCLGEG